MTKLRKEPTPAGVVDPAEDKDTHDIYDRIAKRGLSLSKRCTVSIINGLFQTDYPLDSSVTYHWTENIDDGLKRTLSDTIITIQGRHSYHCEFQMTSDGAMILRMLEYDFHYAIRSRTEPDVVEFPKSVVVYLYDNGTAPDKYQMRIRFGQGTEVTYEVPVFKYLSRTQEDPHVRDQLISLLPFQLLRIRRSIEKERTKENLAALKNIITYDIVDVLEQNVAAGNIRKTEEQQIIEMTQRLYRHIYGRYEKEMPEVDNMMKDALVLPSDKYYYRIRTLEEDLEARDAQISKRDAQISERDAQISERDAQINEKDAQISERDARISEKDAQISERDAQISERDAQISKRDAQILALKRRLQEAGITV